MINNLAIVTPMANESARAVEFIESVLSETNTIQQVIHLVILDQASKDNTRQILEGYAKIESRLHVVWAEESCGIQDAYFRGYQEALKTGADWILEIDAGFSHQPSDIQKFLEAASYSYDCVFGSRFCADALFENHSIKRLIISKGGTLLVNLLLGTRLTDMTGGYQMFSRSALSSILKRGLRSKGQFFQTEMRAYCHGLNITEVPIHYIMTSNYVPTTALLDGVRQLIHLTRLRLMGQLYL